MPTTFSRGPLLQITTGFSLYYWPPSPPKGAWWQLVGSGKTYPSTVYSTIEQVDKLTAGKRVKPKGIGLLAAQTSHGFTKTNIINPLWRSGYGNASPSEYVAGVPVSTNSVYLKATETSKSRLLTKVKEETWNLSTFLGELPATAQYVQQVASGLIKSYTAVKRGDIRKLRRMSFPLKGGGTYHGGGTAVLNTAGNKWMEWRYAVSPMVYDLDDMLKALHRSSLKSMITKVTARGRAVQYEEFNTFYTKTAQNVRTTCNTGIYYSVNPNVAAFKRLGLLNPLATLYELTPLSFVLDWVLPLGTYIGHLDAMAGVDIFASFQSTKTDSSSIVTRKFQPSTSPYKESCDDAVWRRQSYGRSPNVSFDIPPPRFEMGMNMKRVTDSFVLMRQALK